MAEAPSAKILPFREIGSTGLNLQAGMAFEEFMPTLQGINGVKAYQEMSLNNPIVGAILFIIELMIRQVEITIQPFSAENRDKPAADYVNECLHDMSFSWVDTLSEIISFLTYGWSWLDVTYKFRRGGEKTGLILPPIITDPALRDLYTRFGVPVADPANPLVTDDDFASSKFNDGKIGWRKWSIRGQNTLAEWILDFKGGIQGMVQQLDWPVSRRVPLPISKSLLFRTTLTKNNPEGLSILRRAYRSWWYAKRLEESEAIGLERDLSGYPTLNVPEGVNLWNDRDPIMSAGLLHAEKFIQRLRRGESEGAVLPFGWDLKLLSTGSRRAVDVDNTIKRYETRIAMTCAADFLMLGQGSTGSWALSTDKTEMFVLALKGYLKQIEGVINRHAIPPLLRFNNFDPSRPPSLAFGDIETQNLTELAQYLSALTTAGAVTFPDESLSRHLRLLAKLPEPPEDEEMPPLPPIEGEPEELTTEKRKWLKKSLGELREIMLAQKNGDHNGDENFQGG